MKRYYCTYFDRNYLYKAIALIESLQKHEQDFRIFAVCLDEISRIILEKIHFPNVVVVPLHKVEERDFSLAEAKKGRTTAEYYFTLTSTIILHIIKQNPEIDILTYVDADIFFFSSPAPIFDELGDQSVLIHEHRYSPAEAYKGSIYGKYNVGLLCFRNDRSGLQVLKWWRDRCIEWCYYRIEDGKFADQAYLNDWPEKFPGVVVLQHIGAGVAPWNHDQYNYTLGPANQVLVNDFSLVFFHFSAMSLSYPHLVLPIKFGSYPQFTLQEIYWIVIPYINMLYRGVALIRSLIPEFEFGLKDEIHLGTTHVFIAHKNLAGRLKQMALPQISQKIGEEWNCYIPVRI